MPPTDTIDEIFLIMSSTDFLILGTILFSIRET